MRRIAVALGLIAAVFPAYAQIPGGTGGGGGTSGVTSLSTSCPAQTGQPLTGAVTLPFGTGPVARNPVAGATDTLLAGDCGQTIEYTDASSIAVTVPQAGTTGFLSGYVVSVTMKSGSGTATFTTTTSVFSNTAAATFTLTAGQSATLQSDGTNWNVYSGASANAVAGPASAVTTDIATFNGTTGKIIQDSGKTITQATANLFGSLSYINAAGIFYSNPYPMGIPAASGTGAAGSIYCTPFWIFSPVHIEGLSIRVIATSAGNSSAALEGAIYQNLVTTAPANRPGTLVDSTATFATGSATSVTAALTGSGGSTDALIQGLYWTCVQKFDTTATYAAVPPTNIGLVAVMGTATVANAISANATQGVSTTGVFGTWPNFTSSTTWTELGATQAPLVAIETFSAP